MKSITIPNNRLWALLVLAAVVLCLFGPTDLLAGSAESLPWEGPLEKLSNSLTGPVAQAVCLIAIVICGLTLIFGGEMGEFAKRTIYIVIVVAFILGASGFIRSMFVSTGAVL
jgi:type IV secretion system protein VirB2